MSELWEEVGFVVLEGEHDAEAVAEALPVPSTVMARGPQRHALAATIHVGDANASNERRWATFIAAGRTFVAPPGGVSHRTGETHWPIALSARFGDAHWFAISFAAPDHGVFRDGARASGRLGELASEDAVLKKLAEHLGVPEARAFLSAPGGAATILEAESGRWG